VRQHGRLRLARSKASGCAASGGSFPERQTSITIDFPKEPNVMQQPQPTLPFAPAIGFARNRETAPAYWMLDLLWLVLVDGHESGGAFSVMEQWMGQGSGPPIPHIHPGPLGV
jgi:hypothetical protein